MKCLRSFAPVASDCILHVHLIILHIGAQLPRYLFFESRSMVSFFELEGLVARYWLVSCQALIRVLLEPEADHVVLDRIARRQVFRHFNHVRRKQALHRYGHLFVLAIILLNQARRVARAEFARRGERVPNVHTDPVREQRERKD